MRGPGRARPGVTLPELLLVAWLFALVLLVTARFVTAQGRLAATTRDRVRAADLVRTTDIVLNGELRYTAASDRAGSPDSIGLRAVRGGGVVCDGEGAAIEIRYRGVRRPDPRKDSVVLVTAAGTTGSLHAVTAVSTAAVCDGYRLELDPAPTVVAGLALVFETGSYHLADGALRYRRGRAGRQPVTEALLADAAFVLRPDRFEIELRLDPDSLPRVSGSPRAGIRLLNGSAP